MALNINGRMKVKTLRADFKKEFGLTLRVYEGRSFADDDATLASIRKGDSIGGEFAPQRNTKVGNLEDKIVDMFGIKTQVSGSDDSYLCENDKTLASALEADKKLMGKREKKLSSETTQNVSEQNNAELSSCESKSIVPLEDIDFKEALDQCYDYSQEGVIKGYEAALKVLNLKIKPYVDEDVFNTFLLDTGLSAMQNNYEDELERAIAFEKPLIDVLNGDIIDIDEKVNLTTAWIENLEPMSTYISLD